MTVQVRNKQGEKSIRRRRHGSILGATRAGAEAEQRPAQHAEPRPAPLVPPARRAAARFDDGAPSRRRLHGATQDVAVYNCRCGYVFEATVSTSVGCPHCGAGQAW